MWDDFAERDKIEREKKKYPPQEILGFRIIGMRVSGADIISPWFMTQMAFCFIFHNLINPEDREWSKCMCDTSGVPNDIVVRVSLLLFDLSR